MSLFFPLLLAYLFITFLCRKNNSLKSQILLKGSLSIGLAFGFTSCTFFVWLQLFGPAGNNYLISETTFLLLSILIILYASKSKYSKNSTSQHAEFSVKWYMYILVLSFSVILICSLMVFTLRSLNEPHGFWDAWAIWNMRARYLFRGGHYWANAFSNLYSWSHPDYPLLISGSVARIWSYLGTEPKIAPVIIAMFFTFATVTLTIGSLSVIHSKSIGLLAGLVLLGTPYFIRVGAWQIADVPLGFFILSTIVLYCLQDYVGPDLKLIFIAGIMAGFAAWTKNEGILFLVTVIIARLIIILPEKGFKVFLEEFSAFIFGLLPILIIIGIFKIKFAPNNDLFAGQSIESIIERLTDLSRYSTIGKAYPSFFYNKIANKWLIILPICFIFLRRFREKINMVSIKTSFLVVIIMLCAYFIVFLISPHDLSWHIKTALWRLFIQLWPTIVFSLFLLLSSPEELILGKAKNYGKT
jgi:hypothetical protein